MKSKKIKAHKRATRAILSDTLPFEIPVIFSNKHFYKFCESNRIEIKNNAIKWQKGNIALEKLLFLIFGIPFAKNKDESNLQLGKINTKELSVALTDHDLASAPFKYKIRHKDKEFRELTIPHPKNQLEIASFYDKYKESIIYHANKSSFSLRHPVKIATHTRFTDKLYKERLDSFDTEIEIEDFEYDSLTSFFVYKKYSNIFKFYESYEYQQCEQNFEKLLKLDISKCFDSIYSHSLPWAIYGKENIKDQVLKNASSPSAFNNSFPDRFDKLMQHMNGKETNGIVIGPEVSRIFAEIILQSIDQKLLTQNSTLIKNKSFQIYRYIDDYFLFFNDESVRNEVLDQLQTELKEFKLNLSSAKAKEYSKPIITEITIAKDRIASLLDAKIVSSDFESKAGDKRKKIYLNTRNLITQFKTIIKECGVEYKDILNWSLAVLEKRIQKVFKQYQDPELTFSTKEVSWFLIRVLEFAFFIYSVTPRVNTTLRLCRIITLVKEFQKNSIKDANLKHSIDRLIFNNSHELIKKFKPSKATQVETLYLIIQLSQLDRTYRLSPNMLMGYFGFSPSNIDNEFLSLKLNYFAIITLIFYIRNHPQYSFIKKTVEDLIVFKVEKNPNHSEWDGETVMLFMDCISCPYISAKIKRKLLRLSGITSNYQITQILKNKQLWFTNWSGFDYRKALDTKKRLEVY